MRFYGRSAELRALRQEIKLTDRHSRLLVVTGRRRVGKTKLLLKAAEESGRPTLYFLCRRKYTEEALARLWLDEIIGILGLDEEAGPRRLTLANVVRFVAELSRERPLILILDECQELDFVSPGFWADLQGIWDRLKETTRVTLMMSGSVAAALKHIFDDASEPLFGRQDLAMTLRPFDPPLLREIFLSENPTGSADDLLTLYALTGGVARYVEFLAESAPLTRNGMVELVFSERGSFLRSDGATLLANEFRTESPVYESALRAIASGKTKWPEIADALDGQQLSGYLDRLENRYGLIRKTAPLFATGTRGLRYAVSDPYFRFWFRFVEPAQYLALAERGNWTALRSLCLAALDQFTGRTLEEWFHEHYGASHAWTLTGHWWDRKGENEIDLIAINEIDGRFEICEVKRNPDKIRLDLLNLKAETFLRAEASRLKGLQSPVLRGLSLEDVLTHG